MKAISHLESVKGMRYRECLGLFLDDDFVVNSIFEHRPGRTITEANNIWQSLINMNSHPLHFDNEYAATTEFGRPLVSILVTLSIVCGLNVSSTSFNAVANLGWDKLTPTRASAKTTQYSSALT